MNNSDFREKLIFQSTNEKNILLCSTESPPCQKQNYPKKVLIQKKNQLENKIRSL
jgi:hypothetical protein